MTSYYNIFKNTEFVIQNTNTNNKSDDSDASLTSDDEEEVSLGIIGKIYNNKYLIIKYLLFSLS